MALRDDPRADPRMVAAMMPFALDGPPAQAPVTSSSPDEEIYAHCAQVEVGFGEVFTQFFQGLPALDVSRSTHTIKGVDGNDIDLYLHRPNSNDGPLPAVVHTHGGGMVIAAAADPNYQRWRDELAAAGLVVVGVEFRNGAGKLGNHPFPAGLNDCASGLQWTFDNKDALGISNIVVSGESGGGNLSLATALKAKRDGRLDQIDGVYSQCPYISNAYAAGDPRLPSLVENDGYFLSTEMMAPLAKIYDPSGEHATNPLAWPYHAKLEDLEGLPPHVISVNELDPLRDEGLAYFRKLLVAGVAAASRTVNGTCHAGDLLMRKAMPEVYQSSVADLKAFASSL
ncbi:MAG: alpha/beta hydrolase fold domain-containing protein [Acidobacteriota bacterium]|nr:alpha/beta hydrolase fold domain-containing protein [Acidobacteriota bacterium]